MKAITYEQYGPPEVLHLAEQPRPKIHSGEVLVKVSAAALNPVDCEIRRGSLRLLSGWRFPRIPGSDFAGEVVETGTGVKNFQPGDGVFGMSPPLRGGAYAEYLAIPANRLALKPANMNDEEAASIPLVALTALQALQDLAGIQAGDRIFIHGGSGGLGTAAVQLARYFDARVTASCSYRNTELLQQLGVEEVIDYTKTDITKVEGPFDIFFDVFGNMPYRRVSHLIRPKGMHVSAIPSAVNFLVSFWTRLRPGKQARVVVVESKRQDLNLLRQIAETGHLGAVLDKIYPLEKAVEAQQYLETRRASGKIILKIPGQNGPSAKNHTT